MSELSEWLVSKPTAARKSEELLLYLDSTRELYAYKQKIGAELLKKLQQKKYDHAKAPKLWQYVVDEAAKEYPWDVLRIPSKNYVSMFPAVVRRAVAIELANRWQRNAKAGRPDEV